MLVYKLKSSCFLGYTIINQREEERRYLLLIWNLHAILHTQEILNTCFWETYEYILLIHQKWFSVWIYRSVLTPAHGDRASSMVPQWLLQTQAYQTQALLLYVWHTTAHPWYHAHIIRAITTSGMVQKFWIKPPPSTKLGTHYKRRRHSELKPNVLREPPGGPSEI